MIGRKIDGAKSMSNKPSKQEFTKQLQQTRQPILETFEVFSRDDKKEIIEYTLVSSEESDSDLGKISVRSPVGRALIGKEVGEKVTIIVPKGELHYEIKKIFVK